MNEQLTVPEAVEKIRALRITATCADPGCCACGCASTARRLFPALADLMEAAERVVAEHDAKIARTIAYYEERIVKKSRPGLCPNKDCGNKHLSVLDSCDFDLRDGIRNDLWCPKCKSAIGSHASGLSREWWPSEPKSISDLRTALAAVVREVTNG